MKVVCVAVCFWFLGCANGVPTSPQVVDVVPLVVPGVVTQLEASRVAPAEAPRFTLYGSDKPCGTGIAVPGVAFVPSSTFRFVAHGLTKSDVTWIVFHDDSDNVPCGTNITTHQKPGMLHPVESAGGTIFTFDPDPVDRCGTYQIDIAVKGVLIVGVHRPSYGQDCAKTEKPAPPPVKPPTTPPPPSRPPTTLPPPTVPSCEALNPPRAVIQSWAGNAQTISGSVRVSNAGGWTVRLLASTQAADYSANRSEWVKAAHTQTVPCGGQAVITASYPWVGHPAEYWWLEVQRDGVIVAKSAVIVSTVN